MLYLIKPSGGRNVLYRMEQEGKKMCRRMATTENIPVAPVLLEEAKLHFQRQIKHEWRRKSGIKYRMT